MKRLPLAVLLSAGLLAVGGLASGPAAADEPAAIPVGVTIGGLDVGGLTTEAATAAVQQAFAAPLVLHLGLTEISVTPDVLGALPVIDKAIERAIDSFATRENREKFYKFFRELETLYEIISPDPFLRDHLEDYEKLSNLYRIVRNAFARGVALYRELAKKTEGLIRERAEARFAAGRMAREYERLYQRLAPASAPCSRPGAARLPQHAQGGAA